MSEKARVKLKLATITEAERSQDSTLFVLNRTRNPVGNINLTATGEDGQRMTVIIPSTFIPFDMSVYIAKRALLANPQFRRLIAANMVVIVDSKDAEEFMRKSERAQNELRRLLSVLGGGGIDTVESGYAEIEEVEVSNQAKINPAPLDADPFIMAIVGREHEEDPSDLLVELDARRYNIGREDAEYLLANVKSDVLKQWAADLISEIDD